jgi:peptide-methionine (S)-S-oxide reductase
MTNKKRILIAAIAIATAGVLATASRLQSSAVASAAPQMEEGLEKATFAGGCFWCMEPPFEKLEGVVSAVSGYTGGSIKNPSYEQVSSGRTQHMESVQITYDPKKVTYAKLLEVFWHNIDPTDPGGQFCDRGKQYRTAIFFHTEEQRRLAEESKAALEASGKLPKPIVTEIRPASAFYAAEDYHQDYYKKNPIPYKRYRSGCGRDRVLERLWGKMEH